ncbi:MAG TPA: TlpA disulfide reductase family protein, partial [Chitinophagales bacterium]|nr:TlpA disulfide reductase family protein [Chitinophagales bacterium]
MKQSYCKLFPLLISIFILVSCKQFNSYKITATVKNADGVKVYLEDMAEDSPLVIDTITVQNSKFEIKNYSSDGIYRLRFGDNQNNSIFLYIEKNDKIHIDADLNNLNTYKVEGSKGSSEILRLSTEAKKRFAELDSARSHYKNAIPKEKDSLQIVFNRHKSDYAIFIKDFIDQEPINDVACFALNYFGPLMRDEFPYVVDKVDKLHTLSPKSKLIAKWYKETQGYRDAIMETTESGVALNTKASNIILQNPNGDTIQLKNLEGNYVLVDFWASWCQPCRIENPNVVALYKKYHAQGFEIFSVSLDSNKDQ